MRVSGAGFQITPNLPSSRSRGQRVFHRSQSPLFNGGIKMTVNLEMGDPLIGLIQWSLDRIYGQDFFCEAQTGIISTTEEQPLPSAGAEAPLPLDPLMVFGKRGTGSTLNSLKPEFPPPVHAFMLWQTYLLSVNPLSKVIWVPMVQDLVIQATSEYERISAANIALLFSIFAAAVSSLSEKDCQTKFTEAKRFLLAKYLACAQQALAAAEFMRSINLGVLQAFTIFLLAARQSYDANTMWILTGMAIRMGRRLLATASSQSTNKAAKTDKDDCIVQNNKTGGTDLEKGGDFFNFQMKLRVWWQIVLIDGRVTQLAGQMRNFCGDTSDHPLPASLNDSDLSPQMTSIPQPISDRPTEMVFCLLRYEMGKLIMAKSSVLHDPASTLAERDAVIDEVATYLNDKYLIHLDNAIPLHQIAKAGANAAVLKMRLMAHHPGQYPDEGKSLPQAEHDMLFKTSLEMVNILVLGFTTMNIDPFRWHTDVYFQLDAVVFMLIESQTQAPFDKQVDEAWALVASVLLHKPNLVQEKDELGRAVRRLILRAWDSRVRRARQLSPNETSPKPPGLVANVLTELRQQKRASKQNQGKAGAVAASLDNNEVEPENVDQINTQGESDDDTVVPTSVGSTATQPSMAMTMNDYSMDFIPSLAPGHPATTLPSLDASPFSELEVPGWDAADWDSWTYWNSLLQSQPE
ncbi:hypothetical protein SEPCBS119000_006522 [Sporothrix epigloea]|uniref:Xylanolytic transcriptional activator regulatory domain-containing protein n=1 Tax=Sporothrix epigloea TaxID=1892477 RepID=A0ABP0E4T8_9PEZI